MDVPLRLGELVPGHRDRLAEILHGTGAFSDDEVLVGIELFDAAMTSESSPPNQSDYSFLGAFTPEAQLVGYACYGPTPGTDRVYDLYWIAVDAAAHGAGIGTAILTEVERRLQRRHARMLVAETSSRSDYAATRNFYDRRGYAESARVREFYAPGDDRIIFTKRFQHSPDGGEHSHHE
ncbi:MAG TPA: GNAT family N-acetyltransferase [Gemmatimonadaceae bacterium]